VKVDQAAARDTRAAARPAHGSDPRPDVDAMLVAIVKLLARQAAREHLERLANPDGEETIDER
jgi:hypothetical protein